MEAATTSERVRPRALDAATVCEAFQTTVADNPDMVALRTPGGETEITYAEYAERVRGIAAGLAGLGVKPGDTVGVMLLNRPEFMLCDMAALHLGATPFSIYNTSSPEQIAYLFGNAGNRVVITEAQFLEPIRAAGVESVERIVCVDGQPEGRRGPGGEAEEVAPPVGWGRGRILGLAELEAAGGELDFDAAWQAVGPGELATLCYTSGTTGPPKGVELTHANILAQMGAVYDALELRSGDRGTSYLPHAHMADRQTSHYTPAGIGQTITVVADPREIVAALPDAAPTVWVAVPRIWEKIMGALEAQGIADTASLPDEVKQGVLAKLGLGGCRCAYIGAAPSPVELLEFFEGLGLPMCEVWGMSELTCVATANPPGNAKLGTVGPPVPGVEVKLAADGELLARGPILMRGYRKDPEKTAEAIDADGWLHTGDVAEIDDDGYVKIVDRKKELIINAAGKNMSPANIEARLKASSPLIGQACCIGDRRPFNIALLVLDPDTAAGMSAGDPGVQKQIAAAVAEANSHLSRVEQVKRFKLLGDEWVPGGEELTPTMKLKRKPIQSRYEAEIEALYA